MKYNLKKWLSRYLKPDKSLLSAIGLDLRVMGGTLISAVLIGLFALDGTTGGFALLLLGVILWSYGLFLTKIGQAEK